MLISFVQAAPNGSTGYHIQATGPAFPQGYASGDVDLDVESRPCFIPSMRGSGRLYFQLTDAEVKDNLVEIATALHAPSPAYSKSDTEAVQARVQTAIDTAAKGLPKPATSKGKVADEELVAKIVKAVLAALQD